jgi:alpha-ribazole phosphatase
MTNFWLIRHALVDENARAILYGTMDVELCPSTLIEQAPMYQALARRLPQPALWSVTPLSRTRRTAEAIFAAGYPRAPLAVEPDLIEQSLGEWQGLVIARVGAALERLAVAHPDQDLVIVMHGGAIRAAVAHALRIAPDTALLMSVQNLALTRLERHPQAWRVVCVNELPGY